MRPVKPAIVASLCALALAALTLPSQATAARMPSPRESKALRAAFEHGGGHPRRAAITFSRVSTVNGTWARVQYAVPARKGNAAAVAAKPKTGSENFRISHGGKKATRSKRKPPTAVDKDLDNDHFYIDFDWSANGQEDGAKAIENPPPAPGDCSETITDHFTQTFSWHQKFRVDALNGIPSFNHRDEMTGETFSPIPLGHFLGSMQQTETEDDAFAGHGCLPNTSVTCTMSAKTSPLALLPLLGTQTTIEAFDGSFAGFKSSCGSTSAEHFGQRFLGGPFMVLNVGLCCGFDSSKLLGPNPISFPRNAFTDDRQTVSHHTGLCPASWASYNVTSCEDTMRKYNGNVDVSFPSVDRSRGDP